MGYSPPKGRSPTCYSPVRHSHVGPKPHIPVRLACLIRAASVRSEPGSNSPSYTVAPYCEQQRAAFILFISSLQSRTALTLSRSLPLSLPSLFVKNTARLTFPPPRFQDGFPALRHRCLSLLSKIHSPHPSTPVVPLRRKSEFTSLKSSLSSTNAKINLSFYGIVKRSLRRV